MHFLFCHTFEARFDFLDPGAFIKNGIILIHDHVLFLEILILTVVLWGFTAALLNNTPFILKDFYHGSLLEIIWTVIPGLLLFVIALPSFNLLYLMESYWDSYVSIKVIGNQWYWSYDYKGKFFDAYMSQELTPGIFRLLDTDEFLIFPTFTPVRFLITSTDVIHSWGIPALGIKMDACPGRLNQVCTEFYRPGLYYGACYELCGINHAFMPIVIKVISSH